MVLIHPRSPSTSIVDLAAASMFLQEGVEIGNQPPSGMRTVAPDGGPSILKCSDQPRRIPGTSPAPGLSSGSQHR